MGDELRLRRLRLQEAREGSEFKARLSGLTCYDFHARDDIPTWIHAEIRRFLRMDSDPDGRIGKSVDSTDRIGWIRAFVDQVGIGERFYLLVQFDFLPWLDCEIRSADWLDNIVAACGPTVNVVMVANDFSRVVAVFEEEYEYIAFVARQGTTVVS